MLKRSKITGAGLAALLLIAGHFPLEAAQAPVPDAIPVAMLVDLSTGQELFARETDRRFVPASVVKVMTAYTAFKLINEGKLRPSMRYQITEEFEEEWSGKGSSMFLKQGERPTISELLMGVTTVSGNDAAVALARAATGSLDAWLALMNRNAAELGMRETRFGSPNGYPDEGRTFTTAEDLAILGEAITTNYPDLYQHYFGNRGMTWRNITQRNHDPVIGRVEGADGLKTGFTSEAGFTFLGSGERDGRRLVLVLAGSPTSRMRDDAARELLRWGFENFERRTLLPQGAIVGRALVQNGSAGEIALRAPQDVFAVLPVDGQRPVEMSILYTGPVKAPIAEGDPIARLRITIEGQEPFEMPLEAAETVTQASLWQRLVNGLQDMFA